MKTLYTCRAGISLMNDDKPFRAWDLNAYDEGEGPTDSDYTIYVAEDNMEPDGDGGWEILRPGEVKVDTEVER